MSFALLAGSLSLGILSLTGAQQANEGSLIGSAVVVSSVDRPNQALWSVTCVSPTDCWAVGSSYGNFNTPSQTLIFHWNGMVWQVVESANTSSSESNGLSSVACTSPSHCFALGGGPQHALIEEWNGSTWSIVDPANGTDFLSAVACSSASQCWAVGVGGSAGFQQPLFEQWNGHVWASITPIVSYGNSGLEAVTCISDSDCSAVGYYSGRALVMHWDGTGWQPSGIVGGGSLAQDQLSSVACVSSGSCHGVGTHYYFLNHQLFVRTLAARSFGTGWIRVDSADTNDSGVLHGIACTSSVDCWAVGASNAAGGQGLIERWNGNVWVIAASPILSQRYDLNSVTCNSAADCWAVGSYNSVSGFSQALFERWDGNRWSVYSPTNPPLLDAVSQMTNGVRSFGINLPLTGMPGIETRAGPNGNYSIIFTFVNNISSCGIAGTRGAGVIAGPNANQCTMNVTGVINGQTFSVRLDNVTDFLNNTGNITVPVAFLIGDTNADGFVDAIDVSQTKSQSGSSVTSSNFREDVNVDGFIDAIDVALVKSKSGTVLSSSSSSLKPASSAPKSKPRKSSRSQ
jgi:Dockerin type I domain